MPPSSPDRDALIQRLFDEVADLTLEQRTARLDQACLDDPSLRRDIEALLEVEAHTADLFGPLDHPAAVSVETGSGVQVGQILSHYQIVEKLGGGGMGVVYKAHDTKLDRTVALKFLPPDLTRDEQAKRRFIHEAKAASALDHANICTIYDIDETDDGQLFIAMAYYAGETLKKKIGRSPLPVEEALDYVMQVAQGLSRAHEEGIVHRDIKPANVMVTERGRVKIIDFGLAKMTDVSLTQTGTTLGTVAYMSPEQSLGGKFDHRTDLWSLGVILYEMLTGRQPFQGAYAQAVIYSILNDEPEPVEDLRPKLPEGLAGIVKALLRKDPVARYASAVDVLADLRAVQEGVSEVTLRRTAPTGRGARLAKPSVMARRLGLGAAVLVVLVLAAWFFFNRTPIEAPPATAEAEKPSLAVMYFENRTSEEGLGKTLARVLTDNLERYEHFRVVEQQRIFDILRNLGREDVEYVGRDLAAELATHAQTGHVVIGSIVQLGNRIRVTANVMEVDAPGAPTAFTQECTSLEEVIDVVDRLTRDVVGVLGVDPQAYEKDQVTTRSYQAYDAFRKGEEAGWRFKFGEAAEHYRRAVALDSTFAAAYVSLAMRQTYVGFLGNMTPARETLQQAEKYLSRVSQKERREFEAVKAFVYRDSPRAESLWVDYVRRYPEDKDGAYMLGGVSAGVGKFEQAIWALEHAVELDSTFANGYNLLAYTYSWNNDHAGAIAAVRKYMALQPDTPNTYHSAVDVYINAGQFEEALRILEESERRFPQRNLSFPRGSIFLLQGEVEQARAHFHRQTSAAGGTANIGFSYVYEGRYTEAVETLKQAAEQARSLSPFFSSLIHIYLGQLLAVEGNYDEALAAIAEAEELSGPVYEEALFNPVRLLATYYAGSVLVIQGDYAAARARAARIKELVEHEGFDRFFLDFYHLLLAEVHLAQGEGRRALVELDQYVVPAAFSPRQRTMRAAAYALLGQYDEAIQAYTDFYDNFSSAYGDGPNVSDPFYYYYERSKVPYYLGRIYERKGDREQAFAYYEQVLDQWKNADAGMLERADAQARLAALRDV